MAPRLRKGVLAKAGAPDDEVLHEARTADGPRWNGVLVNFMRIVAAIWLVKGLLAWAVILGVTAALQSFDVRTTGFQAAMIYFAIIDLLAAVGLWLASSWGGVLWILAVMSHLILAVFFPRFVSNGSLLIAGFILLITTYLTLSWLASVDE